MDLNNRYHEKSSTLLGISMAIGNVELMQEYFPKHSRMGTATMK